MKYITPLSDNEKISQVALGCMRIADMTDGELSVLEEALTSVPKKAQTMSAPFSFSAGSFFIKARSLLLAKD